jgi:hypothetical protein
VAKKSIIKYRTRVIRGGGRRRRKGMTIPLAVVAGLAPAGATIVKGFRAGGVNGGLEELSACVTGYMPNEKEWHPEYAMKRMWMPLLGGVVVHKLAGRLGINRMIAQAGIPLVRI